MAGIKPASFEQWMKDHTRTVRLLQAAVGKSRVPPVCTSTARPDPTIIAIGVRWFETDTNRSIFVNASQSGFVDAAGNAV